MSEYVTVADLPEPIRAALSSVSYGRKDIRVTASETVQLGDSGGGGTRSFVILVSLSTGKFQTHYGSWGGTNAFARDNAVDNDRGSYALPGDGVAIRGSHGGGNPVYAQLCIPASMTARILPAGPVNELSTAQLTALYCIKSYAGSYRREYLDRHKVTDQIPSLVSLGLLKQNKAGAVSITTEGKNAIGDFRPASAY